MKLGFYSGMCKIKFARFILLILVTCSVINWVHSTPAIQPHEPLHIPTQPSKRSVKHRYLAGFFGTLGVAGLVWIFSPPNLQEQPTTLTLTPPLPLDDHLHLDLNNAPENLAPVAPPGLLPPAQRLIIPCVQAPIEFSQSLYMIRLGIITPQDINSLTDDQRTRFTTSKNEAFEVFLKQFNGIDRRSTRHDFIVHQLILGNMSAFFLQQWAEQFSSDNNPAPNTAQKLLAHLKTKDQLTQLTRYAQLDALLRDLNNPIAQFFKPVQISQSDPKELPIYQETTTFKTVPLVADAAEEILAAAFNCRLRKSFKRQIEMWPEFTTAKQIEMWPEFTIAKTPEKLEKSLQTLLGVSPVAFKDALLSELEKRDPLLKPLWKKTAKFTDLTVFVID